LKICVVSVELALMPSLLLSKAPRRVTTIVERTLKSIPMA
jgi:hypothetical protein